MITALNIIYEYCMEWSRINWKTASLILACMTLVTLDWIQTRAWSFKMSLLLSVCRKSCSVTPGCNRPSVRWGQQLCFQWSTHSTSDSMSRSMQSCLSIVTMEIASSLLSETEQSNERRGARSELIKLSSEMFSTIKLYHCTLASPHSISMMRRFTSTGKGILRHICMIKIWRQMMWVSKIKSATGSNFLMLANVYRIWLSLFLYKKPLKALTAQFL